MQDVEGKPQMDLFGPLASVHHAATREAFEGMLRNLLSNWPVTNIVWNEPKAIGRVDYSEAAKEALGEGWTDGKEKHLQAQVDFFGSMNQLIKETRPGCRVSLFVHAFYEGATLDRLAAMVGLDDFGCDGRPWGLEDGGADDNGEGAPAEELAMAAGVVSAAGLEVSLEYHAITLTDRRSHRFLCSTVSRHS